MGGEQDLRFKPIAVLPEFGSIDAEWCKDGCGRGMGGAEESRDE